jgi:hypothetical protein
MEQRLDQLNRLELGGGRVTFNLGVWMHLPGGVTAYANAQLDDYATRPSRAAYPWRPGIALSLRARFSHEPADLSGTAGFGFWNAPFGDPSTRRPALPQATWFFFAAPPNNLPLPEDGPGQGWFAATIDASRPRAIALAPLAPLVLLLNQSETIRDRLWPAIRQQLAISFAPIHTRLTAWHDYRLEWRPDGCRFYIDGDFLLTTSHSPRGPLGFVCWMDNQYLVATPRGRFAWGTTPPRVDQWLEVAGIDIQESR